MNKLRFVFVGVGGVGGYFGARLARAGNDVTFLARGATVAALRSHGLRIESILGNFVIQPVKVVETPAEAGQADVVVIAVKAWQLPEVASSVRALIGADTVVLPLQNGVEASDQLASILGTEHVLGGLCRIISAIAEPGVIRHSGADPSMTFGELNGAHTERVARLRDAFVHAGVTTEVPDDIHAAIWEKALFISSLGAISSIARSTIGELRSMAEARELLTGAMREVETVGTALGVKFREEVIRDTMAYVDALPAHGTSSLQRDVEACRPSEIDAQLGSIVRMGRQASISTPIYDFAWSCLLPQEHRARS